jgi:hypothetical protein
MTSLIKPGGSNLLSLTAVSPKIIPGNDGLTNEFSSTPDLEGMTPEKIAIVLQVQSWTPIGVDEGLNFLG